MTKLEIDITKKILRIEYSNCSKTFIKTFDEFAVRGIVKCPHCGQEHFLTTIKP